MNGGGFGAYSSLCSLVRWREACSWFTRKIFAPVLSLAVATVFVVVTAAIPFRDRAMAKSQHETSIAAVIPS